MGKLLSKAEIVGVADLKIEEVEVPEWGGTVGVKGMTGADRDDFESSLYTGEGKNRKQNLKNLRARLVGMTLVDEDGQRLFSDAEIKQLSGKSAAALNRCFEVAQRLNGMEAKAVEEAKNGSPADPSADSTTA